MFKIINLLFLSLSAGWIHANTEKLSVSVGHSPAKAVVFSDPEALVSDLLLKAVDFENWIKQEDFLIQLRNYFDLSYMSRFVLGRSWKQIDSAQFKEFTDLFAETQALSLLPQIKDLDSIRLLKKRSKDNKTLLTFSYQRERRQAIEVAVFVRKNQDGLVKIYDFKIEDIRLLLNWRAQIKSIISRQGFEGMISDMRSALEKKRSGFE